jgi:CHAT domain-containing protein
MRTSRDVALRALAVLLAMAAGLAVSVSLLLLLETSEAQAAESLPAELQAAEQLYRNKGPEAAQAEFTRLAGVYRDRGEGRAEATSLRFLGEIHWRLGSYEASMTVLGQALELARHNGDLELEAKTQNVLGLLYWDLGDYPAALAAFDAAGNIATLLGDRKMQGTVLNNASLVLDEQGEYRRSLQQYAEVLRLYDGQDFPRGEGDTLGNIGGVHLLLGEYRQALNFYRRALAISGSLESVTSMSQDYGNIALCELGLGQINASLDHFDQAIRLAEQAGMQQDVAFWLRGKANARIRQGQYDQGLALHGQAIDLYRLIGSKTEAVEALHDLGELYLALGDATSAAKQFEQSMTLAREIGLSRGVTLNQLALGNLQLRREAWDQADALYHQAGQRARETGEFNLEAQSLLRLAALHHQQGVFQSAYNEAQQSRSLADQIDSTYLKVESELQMADSASALETIELASSHYENAISLLPSLPDPDLAWRIHHGRGLLLAASGELESAILELERAIGYIEGVRDRLEEQRFRAGWVQDKYQVYVDLVRLQMRAGQNAHAFSTAERLRSRSYLDLVEQNRDVEGDSEDTEGVVLRERIRQLRHALSEERGVPDLEQRQAAISLFSEELLAAERTYEALLDDHRRMPKSGRLATAPTYEDVRRLLAVNSALIEYVVAEDSVLIFVLTRERLLALTGGLGRERLQSRVELLRDLIRRPDGNRWQRPAASLAEALVMPIMSIQALEGIDHLYLVPHGTLNYLPFALLPAGAEQDGLLLENFTLSYLPTAAALLDDGPGASSGQSLLALAPSRSRLKHAPAEANSVFELFQPDSRLLAGDAATETRFKEVAGAYDVIHLATHGYFNKLNPLLSGLELEADGRNDGLLELHEILGLKLDAQLVTLSACQTGMGSGHFAEIPAGDDFVGLTRAFLYAGSDAVMATLWEVDDASTALLMQKFYTDLRVSAETSGKAVALSGAQRALRNSETYNHPYYWAPFILMGAGRPVPGKAPGV